MKSLMFIWNKKQKNINITDADRKDTEKLIKDLMYPTVRKLCRKSKLDKEVVIAVLEYELEHNNIGLDGRHIIWIYQPHLDEILAENFTEL